MSGIKLSFNDKGDADVAPWRPDDVRYDCIVDCEHAGPDWVCEYTNSSIWDHWRNPGWCPLFKWYREYRYKEMSKAQETGVTVIS